MTATLTPSSVDSDTIQDLEDHWDDHPMCRHGDAPAVVRLIIKCCHRPTLECPTHYQKEREIFEACDKPYCMDCKHDWAGATWRDVFAEVPL